MKKVIYLPFENLPQRYTKMWNDCFIAQMSNNDIVVWGNDNKDTQIKTGEFLDTYGTISYKTSQMCRVSKLFRDGAISNGDVFFVPDIFYPGLAAIRYMAELSDIKVKIVAFNHAGRADKDDFVQRLGSWSDVQEQAWHDMCDVVIVGSEYHKRRVESMFNPKTTIVAGAVWSKAWMDEFTRDIDREKKPYIIWPHRPSKEKRFDLFLEIARNNPELDFVITSSGGNRLQDVQLPQNVTYTYGLTKLEYYKVFAQADGYLSTAFQETFGYTLQEAIYFNCKVVVPNYACYSEYAHKDSIFEYDDMVKQSYLTDVYKSGCLNQSKLHKDNAEDFYHICKSLM